MSLKRIIRNWLLEESNGKGIERPSYHGSAVCHDDTDHDINVNITVANGGFVVRFSRYNKSTHNMEYSPYIISDGEDLETRLSELITFETLRNS